nr:glucose 1,6-bisphosphate synthase-like [Onthophagus taurus]
MCDSNQKIINLKCEVTDLVYNKFSTNDETLDPIIQNYLKWEKIQSNREHIIALVRRRDIVTLKKMLLNRLEIIGGVIKGDMIPGYNGMNDLVVIQTGQGLLKYLENVDKANLREFGIVIGYDARNNSKRYAELIATIFVVENYPVKMFCKEIITPFVSFTVTKYDCVAGIMISGGVCPKNVNGIKIFSSNGCQVTPLMESEIQKFILENLEPQQHCWDTEILEYADLALFSDPYEEILESYIKLVNNIIIKEYRVIASKSPIKFVFTALHGVAYDIFKQVVNNLCVKIEPVPTEIEPDPKFPLIKSPNPENPLVLNKAKNLAQKSKLRYVIGADPDGCRTIFSKLRIDNITWRTFDPNELGALFGWWVLDQYKKKKEKKVDLKNVYMIASCVSSKILRTMAEIEKFNFVETLPGFGWIANEAYDLKQKGKEVIFCFDDDYGYMFTDELLDRDGIIASVQIMTIVSFLNSQQQSIGDKLDEIYTQYGFHINIGSYFTAQSYEVIEKIFDEIRHHQQDNVQDKLEKSCNCAFGHYENPNQIIYPQSVGHGKFCIDYIRDVSVGYDNSQPDRKSTFAIQPDMQMITFLFINGINATLRMNPKEAKLRYCAELIVKKRSMSISNGRRLVSEVIHRIICDFINPTKNGLSLRKY